MTAYSARALSTNKLQNEITQALHGFVVGDVVTFNGTDWVFSQANSLFACQGTCMVSFVIDVNNFVITQEGYITNITTGPYAIGVQFYVSPTVSGSITATQPITAGQVNLPCFVTDTATSGYFFGGSGELIESGQLFTWNTKTAGPVNMLVNNGYITDSGGTINLNLPASASVGDMIRITNIGGNFSVRQTNLQFITLGTASTTAGPTGHLDSNNTGDTIELLCVVPGANTQYQVISGEATVTLF